MGPRREGPVMEEVAKEELVGTALSSILPGRISIGEDGEDRVLEEGEGLFTHDVQVIGVRLEVLTLGGEETGLLGGEDGTGDPTGDAYWKVMKGFTGGFILFQIMTDPVGLSGIPVHDPLGDVGEEDVVTGGDGLWMGWMSGGKMGMRIIEIEVLEEVEHVEEIMGKVGPSSVPGAHGTTLPYVGGLDDPVELGYLGGVEVIGETGEETTGGPPHALVDDDGPLLTEPLDPFIEIQLEGGQEVGGEGGIEGVFKA